MMFGSGHQKPDPLWKVAASTQVFTADQRTVDRLAGEVDAVHRDAPYDGLLIARPHPTGWFVWAVRRDDLTDEDLGYLRELVVVRTYLLLRQGPGATVWSPIPGHAEWRSPAPSLITEHSGA
jgi:hypothetical protein